MKRRWLRRCSLVDDVRWFAPNAYAGLVVPELRRRGIAVALEGTAPARLAFAMGGRGAEPAWRYARAHGVPLVVYVWDLPPRSTGAGRYDPVWRVGSRLIRIPRLLGGYRRRAGFFSRLRYVAASADAVWAARGMTRDILGERFGVAAERVPYCYDSERFRPAPDVKRESPPTILCVSRMEIHKNQAAVLRAAAHFGHEVQVRLIGRGPEHQRLHALAKGLSVRCRIELEADDATVTHAYHTAAVVAAPSCFEGFGLTPIEALGSGTAVVASDIPPHREYLDGAVRLVPLDDEPALAGALHDAMGGPPPDPASVSLLTIPAAADRFEWSLRRFLR
jgi:glycosyltransferase involved in cell wall biosynthesis